MRQSFLEESENGQPRLGKGEGMGSPSWNDSRTRGATFAVDGHEIDSVIAAVPKGEAMQAQAKPFNGSAEHRIAEALQEAEVIEEYGSAPWAKIITALGFAITIGMLVWMLFK